VKHTSIPDELLNAYIDNELDRSMALKISALIARDSGLRARMEELRTVKDLTRLSYAPATEKASTPVIMAYLKNRWFLPSAASLLFFVGALGGWFANSHSEKNSLLSIATHVDDTRNTAAGNTERNVMIHVTSQDKFRWKIILGEIERTLRKARASGKNFKLQLVTNGKGIGLIRKSNNDFAEKLHQLIKTYPNFAVQACAQTIKRLYKEKHTRFQVLPGVRVVPSAIGEVIDKRRNGWVYIKI